MKDNVYYFRPGDSILKELAKSCNAKVMAKEDFMSDVEKYRGSKILVRGLRDRKVMRLSLEYGIDYYYVETGYFGNIGKYYTDMGGKPIETMGKLYHRIVKNDVQYDKIIKRSNDRFKLVQRTIEARQGVSWNKILKPWKRTGNTILVCPPSAKSALYFNGFDVNEWTRKTVKRVKKNTGKKVRVREKPRSRTDRLVYNTIQSDFDNDVFALVTYNSIAAIEAVLHGVPIFTLGPNAARPMGLKDLSKIDNPIYPDREKWLRHLSYGQFTVPEMSSPKIWRVLNA